MFLDWETKVRSERRMGELLKEMPGKGEHGDDRKSIDIVSLDELGIRGKKSS